MVTLRFNIKDIFKRFSMTQFIVILKKGAYASFLSKILENIKGVKYINEQSN